jgi:hypothetical protein
MPGRSGHGPVDARAFQSDRDPLYLLPAIFPPPASHFHQT